MYEKNLRYDKFIFNGFDCKDNFGIVRCNFDSEEDSISGGDIEINTYSLKNINEWKITSSKYSSPLSFSISFCKCDGDFFDFEEMKKIGKWLVREDGYKLLEFYDGLNEDGTSVSEEICYECKATKNIDWKLIGERCIGGTVSFICKHPYARTKTKGFVMTDNSKIISCNSDTTYTYPYLISILSADNQDIKITIKNNHEERTTEIKNCIDGEQIKIDAISKIIQTDRSYHNIANDFNYIFPRFYTGDEATDNEIIITGNLTCFMYYYEARKVVV